MFRGVTDGLGSSRGGAGLNPLFATIPLKATDRNRVPAREPNAVALRCRNGVPRFPLDTREHLYEARYRPVLTVGDLPVADLDDAQDAIASLCDVHGKERTCNPLRGH